MPQYHGISIGIGITLLTPTADGISGQAVTTDGAGTLTFSTVGASSPLTLTAGSASEIPLTLKAATGQTANLQEWTDSSDVVDAKVDASGHIHSRRVYVDDSLSGYAYIDTTSSGYGMRLVDRYGQLLQTANWGINFDRPIGWGNASRTVISRTATPGSNTLEYTPNYSNSANADLWVLGTHGAGGYAQSSYTQSGTGFGVLAGPGASPTDVDGDGGDAGCVTFLLNPRGAATGTGTDGAHGVFRIRDYSNGGVSGTIGFSARYDGKTLIGRDAEPADAMLEIKSLTSGDDGLEIVAADGTAVLRTDQSTTAGDTRFLIYDVDNATLERVTVGAADSGGTGYKVLRIAN